MVDDGPLSALDHQIAATIQKALALRQKLEQLNNRTYSSESPRILIDLLLRVVDQTTRELFAVSAKAHASSSEVIPLQGVLDKVSAAADPVVRSADGNLPWGLVYPLELLCRRISPESAILIYPHWEHGYSYTEVLGRLRELISDLRDGAEAVNFQEYPRYLALFSLPDAQAYDVLENAAWGHEIGHHIDTVFNVSGELLTEPILARRLAASMASARDGETMPSPDLLQRDLAPRIAVLHTWVKELVADLFSVHVFGPASLFAFTQIVPSLDEDQPARSGHPPAWLRVTFMLKALDDLGYDALFRDGAIAGSVSTEDHQIDGSVKAAVMGRLALLRALSRQMAANRVESPLTASVLRDIREVGDELMRRVCAYSQKRWACMVETLASDAFSLVDRLKRGVPPCEVDLPGEMVGRPTTLAAIVNAGWFYRIWQRIDALPQDMTDATRSREKLARLNALVLKAIELSVVKTQLGGQRRRGGAHG